MTQTSRPSGTGHPSYSETLPCEATSARPARLLVSAALRTWGIDELTDAAGLIVTEMVANSVNHTRCRLVRVTITRPSLRLVRLAVTDKSHDVPKLSRPSDDQEAGRGLALVASMSTRWGYDHHRWGKSVWAELGVIGQ
ncbi:ATP-binding protein [Streptomyces avidinii]